MAGWRSERVRATVAVATMTALVGAIAAPTRQEVRHLDHVAFLDVLRRMRLGEGFYDAFVAGMASIDAQIDHVRAVRQPAVFFLWEAIPPDALIGGFFLLAVLGSVVGAVRMVAHPEAALAVGGFVAVAGVYGGVDAWLVSELWAVPLVVAACNSWVHGRDRSAAAWCAGAALVRETTLLLPLGFALAAWRRKTPTTPWVLTFLVSGASMGLHWLLSLQHLSPADAPGHPAPMFGGGGIEAVIGMTSFLVMPAPVGMFVWLVGLGALWRSPLRPAIGLALLPVSGLLTNRPYWGFVAMPLCLLAIAGIRRPAGQADDIIDLRDEVVREPRSPRGREAMTVPADPPTRPLAPS